MNDTTFFKVNGTNDEKLIEKLAETNGMQVVKLEYSNDVHTEYDHRMNNENYRKVYNLVEKIINDNDYNKNMFGRENIIKEMIESYYTFYSKLHGITERLIAGIEKKDIKLSNGRTDRGITIDIGLFLDFIGDRESERFFNFN